MFDTFRYPLCSNFYAGIIDGSLLMIEDQLDHPNEFPVKWTVSGKVVKEPETVTYVL